MKATRITYQGTAPDAPEVKGVVVTPTDAPNGSCPLIIYNTPGTKKNNTGQADSSSTLYGNLIPYAQKIGESGSVVMASSLRDKDEYGGADVQDVLDIMELGKQDDKWDGKNVMMIGFSRGAMMTYLAIRDGAKLTGAVIAAGETNLCAGEEERAQVDQNQNIRKQNDEMIVLKEGETIEDALLSRSAITFAGQLINTPMLIVHGANDKAVDVRHSKKLAAKMTELGGTNHQLRIVDEMCMVTNKGEKQEHLEICGHGVLTAKNEAQEYFIEKEVADWCNARITSVKARELGEELKQSGVVSNEHSGCSTVVPEFLVSKEYEGNSWYK